MSARTNEQTVLENITVLLIDGRTGAVVVVDR